MAARSAVLLGDGGAERVADHAEWRGPSGTPARTPPGTLAAPQLHHSLDRSPDPEPALVRRGLVASSSSAGDDPALGGPAVEHDHGQGRAEAVSGRPPRFPHPPRPPPPGQGPGGELEEGRAAGARRVVPAMFVMRKSNLLLSSSLSSAPRSGGDWASGRGKKVGGGGGGEEEKERSWSSPLSGLCSCRSKAGSFVSLGSGSGWGWVGAATMAASLRTTATRMLRPAVHPGEGLRRIFRTQHQQLSKSTRAYEEGYHALSEYRASLIQQRKEQLYDLIAALEANSKTFLLNKSLLKVLSTQVKPRPEDPQWCSMNHVQS
ncbi:hypothetical protein ZWY2020_045712 [Hordeum vulgare]|nr:hypothetical protein ZWY2020_045712 [Hordeum vulgare]